MIALPQSIFDKYNEFADYMLANDNFSRLCTLYYPPIKESCSNCITLGSTSNNVYQDGNPAPFSFNGCNLCGGKGYREKDITSTIRLRISWRYKDWIKVGNINIPNAACQVIGYASDLKKLLTCKFIRLSSEENLLEQDFKLSGKPAFHGFGKTRYFIAYLEDA
jgi:hypothetical protein